MAGPLCSKDQAETRGIVRNGVTGDPAPRAVGSSSTAVSSSGLPASKPGP